MPIITSASGWLMSSNCTQNVSTLPISVCCAGSATKLGTASCTPTGPRSASSFTIQNHKAHRVGVDSETCARSGPGAHSLGKDRERERESVRGRGREGERERDAAVAGNRRRPSTSTSTGRRG
eukprot:3453781-Rhodomonas_salina.2